MTVCSTCKHANYCEIVAGGYSSQVKSCRDYRKGETTNEEWFCGLSTEEKAKWMAKHMSFCEVCEIQTCRGDGCQRFDRGSMTETDAFREWLKEKHDGNMGRNP